MTNNSKWLLPAGSRLNTVSQQDWKQFQSTVKITMPAAAYELRLQICKVRQITKINQLTIFMVTEDAS